MADLRACRECQGVGGRMIQTGLNDYEPDPCPRCNGSGSEPPKWRVERIPGDSLGYWHAIEPNGIIGWQWPTWAQAMDYALTHEPDWTVTP